MRENVSLLAVLAIATCLPRNRSSVDEQTEECLRRLETARDQSAEVVALEEGETLERACEQEEKEEEEEEEEEAGGGMASAWDEEELAPGRCKMEVPTDF
ncbi:hypothetical protein H920_18283 [Fukomys damarensis]|uniref:Secreted protein n=1 Tax=Fukomys damarensis TaxID=885580 RepID=A0A091CRC8_FUKDA|nr:hypothetical protein H920_18283 [Fukomys damarensis]